MFKPCTAVWVRCHFTCGSTPYLTRTCSSIPRCAPFSWLYFEARATHIIFWACLDMRGSFFTCWCNIQPDLKVRATLITVRTYIRRHTHLFMCWLNRSGTHTTPFKCWSSFETCTVVVACWSQTELHIAFFMVQTSLDMHSACVVYWSQAEECAPHLSYFERTFQVDTIALIIQSDLQLYIASCVYIFTSGQCGPIRHSREH